LGGVKTCGVIDALTPAGSSKLLTGKMRVAPIDTEFPLRKASPAGLK